MRDVIQECYETAKEKGWWDDAPGPDDRGFHDMVAGKLMLIVSEAAEALEDLRDPKKRVGDLLMYTTGKPYGFPSELADIVIRVFDLAGYLGIDLDEAIRLKMAHNRTREFRHGGKRL